MQLISELQSEFAARVKRNSGYSLRAFARSLKIDSSSLSSLLQGKRTLTPKGAKKLLQQLDWAPERKRRLLMSALGEGGADTPVSYEALSEQTLELIAGWEHFAILSYLETTRCVPTVTGISRTLGIGSGIAIAALGRLEKAGMVERAGPKWRMTGKSLTTSVGVPSAALKVAHTQYLEKALYSLQHHDVKERDITGITMAIRKDRLPEAKRMIRDFRRQLSRYLESGDRTEVYRLNVQLFPIKK